MEFITEENLTEKEKEDLKKYLLNQDNWGVQNSKDFYTKSKDIYTDNYDLLFISDSIFFVKIKMVNEKLIVEYSPALFTMIKILGVSFVDRFAIFIAVFYENYCIKNSKKWMLK